MPTVVIDIGPGFDGFVQGTCPEKYQTFGNQQRIKVKDLLVNKVLDYCPVFDGRVFDESDPLKAQANELLGILAQGGNPGLLVGHSYFPMVLQAAILINPE